MKAFYVILLCLTSFLLQAQNLVPNPGFEVQDTCPGPDEIWLAQPWTSPTLSSPDLFNTTCSIQQGFPRNGIGHAGGMAYDSPDAPGGSLSYREFIQVRLSSPLVAGSTYQVSFYVARDPAFVYAIDRMGLHLSPSGYNTGTIQLPSLTPHIEHTGSLLTSTNYVQISGTYVANGGEEYIIIGNFRSDANTNATKVGTGTNPFFQRAYYRIDDVEISYITNVINQGENATLELYPNPVGSGIPLSLNLPPTQGDYHVSIYDVLGKLMYSEVVSTSKRHVIPTDNLNNGHYIVVVKDKGIVKYRKQLVVR